MAAGYSVDSWRPGAQRGASPAVVVLHEQRPALPARRAAHPATHRPRGWRPPGSYSHWLLLCGAGGVWLRSTDALAWDETRKLRRHVAGSCIRCGTSISTAWRRALRCAASARHDYGPLHARTDPATLCGSAREDISREFP